MRAVYKRELRSYFTNMTGYVFIGVLLLLTGIMCTVMNLSYASPNFEYTLSTVSYIFLLIVPILTMNVFAEERRSKTDRLLYSLPLSTADIIAGKFLALMTVFAVPVLLMCLIPPILSMYGTVSFATAYSSLAGFFLMGCSLLAFGFLISSLTESPVIAAVISFFSLLLIYLLSTLSTLIPRSASASAAAFLILAASLAFVIWFFTKNITVSAAFVALCAAVIIIIYNVKQSALEGAFPDMLDALCVYDRLGSFLNGMFDVGAAVYFLSVTAVCLVLAGQIYDRRRYN